MKKLLTFLFALSLSVTTFGTVYTWNHAGFPTAGDWNTTTHWVPNGTPGSGDEVYFQLNKNVLTVTINNDISIMHLFLDRVAGDAGINHVLNFIGASDGVTITFETSSLASHDFDVAVNPQTTLNCNSNTSKRVKIVCQPSVRFLVDGTNNTNNRGIFKPAIYEPCTGGKGFVLQANSTSHAELVQKLNSNDLIRGWQDFLWGTGQYHYVCAPVSTDQVTIKAPVYPSPPPAIPPAAGTYDVTCWKANSKCFLEGNNVRPYDIATQAWGTWYDGWKPCEVTLYPDVAFTLGQGLLVYANGSTTSVYGDFNTNYNFIYLPTSSSKDNWSMVGNPFPSGVRFNWNSGSGLVGWDWRDDEVSPWVAYWSNTTSPAQTFYYNWYTNPPTEIPPQGATNPYPNVIPRSQGFFVYTLVDNAGLGVKNEARQFVPDKSIGKSDVVAVNRLYLKLEDGVNAPDYAVVSFNENGENNYNSQDIMKMFANDPQKSEIYCKKSDDKNVISNTLPAANGNIAVPVYMNVGNSGSYTLTAEKLSSFGTNVGIVLKDNKTNTTTDLRTTPSYTFTAENGDDAGRFILFFTDVLGLNKLSDNSIKVFSSGNSIYIQNNNSSNVKGSVTVYDMVGKELMNVNLTNELVTKLTTSFDRGYYIVSIRTEKGLLTQKVYLN